MIYGHEHNSTWGVGDLKNLNFPDLITEFINVEENEIFLNLNIGPFIFFLIGNKKIYVLFIVTNINS